MGHSHPETVAQTIVFQRFLGWWCAGKDETANWQIWIDPVTYGRNPPTGDNGIIWEALRNRPDPLLTAEIKAIVRAQAKQNGLEPLSNRRIGECIYRLDRGGWLDAWEHEDGRQSWKLVTPEKEWRAEFVFPVTE